MTSTHTALTIGSGGKVPAKYADIAERYELIYRSKGVVRIRDIKLEDVERLLEKYATDLTCDVYTMRDVLHISRNTLYRMLNSDDFKDLYFSAKSQRAAVAYRRGFDVLEETYAEAKAGDASREAVNAARHLANYCGTYAQNLTGDAKSNEQVTGVTIQVNLPQFSNLNGNVVDVKTETNDEKD